MSLQEYERKRSFRNTPEPRGRVGTRRDQQRRFVIQLHHATARHYDFRLEVDGVLRSWAVPKGPSLRTGDKRLAVEVEDHPLPYASFEGTIPKGHYGAGHVAIFDEGTWAPVDAGEDPARALREGKLAFRLDGHRLRGEWNLVRTSRRSGKPQWLLFKRDDEHVRDLDADDLLEGVVAPPPSRAGHGNERHRASRAGNGNGRPRARAAAAARKVKTTDLPGARRAGALGFLAPMLTTAAKAAPEGGAWWHEWKWDGYRLVAAAGANKAPRMWSRNALAWEDRVPEIVAAIAKLRRTVVLDGELIAVDSRGHSDFNALQHALKHGQTAQLRYAVFDLMRLDDTDLTGVAIEERKALLRDLLHGADPRLFYSEHVGGRGEDLFEAARELGLEGIISKRAGSPYRSGRSTDWLKIKAVETREYVVVGHTPPKGSRQGIGAFLLARSEQGKLVYAGRVGSGISSQLLAQLPAQLRKLHSDTPTVPLPAHTPLPKGRVQWLEPRLVAEVIFRGWGKEGLLRQASFLRLRPDRAVLPEGGRPASKSSPGGVVGKPAKSAAKTAARSAARALEQPAPLVKLTSPTRIVYPDIKATKQQVFDYYLRAGEQVLEEVGGRLLSIVRCPDGIDGPRFFQKHAGPGFGESVRRVPIREAGGEKKEYFCIDDVAGLMNLVQMSAIELHPWGSRVETLEQPDRLVFDLDPDPTIGWAQVRRAAMDVRDALATLGLGSWPRLTGGKGVHVVVPLKPSADWDAAREFCGTFASAMAMREPGRFVATMSKAKRSGRIFIDWLRNARGATSVAGWSLRARAGAPAAVVVTWDELARVRRPDRYTLKDAAARPVPDVVAELVARAPALPAARR
jgi:bifunctional non-homologous end joining protein LigD